MRFHGGDGELRVFQHLTLTYNAGFLSVCRFSLKCAQRSCEQGSRKSGVCLNDGSVVQALRGLGTKKGNSVFTYFTYRLVVQPMKQNITISVEKSLLRKARALASQRGASVSAMLAQELVRIADRENGYERARRRALARLSAPFPLGGHKRLPREALHDRENLR